MGPPAMTAPGRPIAPVLAERTSGVLLPLFSLPAPHGVGDAGPAARTFVDWLAAAGQRWWQLLPLGPVDDWRSPYSGRSAFAAESAYVSLEDLAAEGWLEPRELRAATRPRSAPADTLAARERKRPLLARAAERFYRRGGTRRRDWREFLARAEPWLAGWLGTQDGDPEVERFAQYAFDRQWRALRRHAARRGVLLFGDLPLFVARDAADVRARPELFRLDERGRPAALSGCPPDAFARNGQLWGHPHYAWRAHRAEDFRWWLARLEHELGRFDALRLDHFIGYVRVWTVPAGARSARRGRWRPAPGREILERLAARISPLPLVAEDLGAVTAEVRALARDFAIPGMRVLQFGFHDGSEHAPCRLPEDCVLCTGTHDTDTAVGWLAGLPRAQRARVLAAVGGREEEIGWSLVRSAWTSRARVAIAPVQDLLGLGPEHRTNAPGRPEGNWRFRLPPRALTRPLAARLLALTRAAERTPARPRASRSGRRVRRRAR